MSCDQFFPNHLELSFDKRTLTREDLLIHEYGSRLLFLKKRVGGGEVKKGGPRSNFLGVRNSTVRCVNKFISTLAI